MSYTPCEAVGMTKKRITLEPELEALAGGLGVFDRLLLAEKFARWERQLRISATILARPTSKRQRPPRLRGKRLQLN